MPKIPYRNLSKSESAESIEEQTAKDEEEGNPQIAKPTRAVSNENISIDKNEVNFKTLRTLSSEDLACRSKEKPKTPKPEIRGKFFNSILPSSAKNMLRFREPQPSMTETSGFLRSFFHSPININSHKKRTAGDMEGTERNRALQRKIQWSPSGFRSRLKSPLRFQDPQQAVRHLRTRLNNVLRKQNELERVKEQCSSELEQLHRQFQENQRMLQEQQRLMEQQFLDLDSRLKSLTDNRKSFLSALKMELNEKVSLLEKEFKRKVQESQKEREHLSVSNNNLSNELKTIYDENRCLHEALDSERQKLRRCRQLRIHQKNLKSSPSKKSKLKLNTTTSKQYEIQPFMKKWTSDDFPYEQNRIVGVNAPTKKSFPKAVKLFDYENNSEVNSGKQNIFSQKGQFQLISTDNAEMNDETNKILNVLSPAGQSKNHCKQVDLIPRSVTPEEAIEVPFLENTPTDAASQQDIMIERNLLQQEIVSSEGSFTEVPIQDTAAETLCKQTYNDISLHESSEGIALNGMCASTQKSHQSGHSDNALTRLRQRLRCVSNLPAHVLHLKDKCQWYKKIIILALVFVICILIGMLIPVPWRVG